MGLPRPPTAIAAANDMALFPLSTNDPFAANAINLVDGKLMDNLFDTNQFY